MKENINKYINFILENYELNKAKNTELERLFFYSSDQKSELEAIFYEPSICVILQGSKIVEFGNEQFKYNISKFLLVSTNIPAKIKIEEASKLKPFVSLQIIFTLDEILEVFKEINIKKQTSSKPDNALFFGDLNESLLKSIFRYLDILKSNQENKKFLSNLIIKEIIYFLLTNKNSSKFLQQYILTDSISHKIAKAITKIKQNYQEKINIKNLASSINMSESSLYANFKKITSLSPIQYQKRLRLEEAKKILISQNSIEISQVAFDVGYESPSQFSREYSRMFGLPPKKDVLKINQIRC